MTLNIIVNCGPCEEYVERCLQSIQLQTVSDWKAFVTVDACTDRTVEMAVAAINGDRRIHIHRNAQRRFSMYNLVHAVLRSNGAQDDVIVILDGDDSFATPHALRTIAAAYNNPDCWMTYGSWVSDPPDLEGMRSGQWPAYSPKTTNFRTAPWLGTAVRTWKRWLWDLIDDADFRDSAGEYLRVTEDQAVMLPLLDMSGTEHAKHISEVLMVYNRSSPHACGLTRCEEMLANGSYLRSLPPYARLKRRPGSPAEVLSLRAQRTRVLSTHRSHASTPVNSMIEGPRLNSSEFGDA